MKIGLLLPIPKAKKDSSIKDNNRGITLVPILYKIFEKLIIHRESLWLESTHVNDEIQSSRKKGCSCLHTSFLLQETIALNRSNGSTVYTAFLDTRKAFATIWVKGLLYKLLEYGIDSRLYWLIKSAYTDYKCSVMINGEISEWFKPMRGVHQGAPMSMYLYTIFVNDLLRLIKNSGHGISVLNHITTSPIHADDLALQAMYKPSLNISLSIVYDYSVKWRYEFNTDKTVLMIWGKDMAPNISIKFGDNMLSPNTTCKHMGVQMCNDAKKMRDIYEERINSARKIVYASRGLGSEHLPVPPKVMSEIYNSVAIPKMLYGLDVSPVEEANLILLDNAHRMNSKIIQGLPMSTPNPAPLATLGWLSVEAQLAIVKVMFIIRTLCLPFDNLYRNILTFRINMLMNMQTFDSEKFMGPVKEALIYAKKYNLIQVISETLIDADPAKNMLRKNQVKSIVKNIDYQRWRATCLLYPELKVYCNSVQNIGYHVWWSLIQLNLYLFKYVSAVMALLMGKQPKGMQCFFKSKFCELCNDRLLDGPSHILFACCALERDRQILLASLWCHMPQAMKQDFRNMLDNDKTAFILAALRCNVIIEDWSPILIAISKYVYHMYKVRKRIFELSNGNQS